MKFLFILFTLIALANSSHANSYFSIDTSGNVKPYSKTHFQEGAFAHDIVAVARFANRINATGWSELDLQTNAAHADHIQAYYAGILEGFLTANLIDDFRTNIELAKPHDQSSETCQVLKHFISENLHYLKKNLDNGSVYWQQVGLVLYQLAGLDDGYDAAKGIAKSIPSKKPHLNLDPCNSLLLNMYPEVGDIVEILMHSKKQSQDEVESDHCSAIIKWIPEKGEVLVSHNTWTTYVMMVRLLKKYTLNYKTSQAKAVSMSSYPGVILSFDDFYITSQHMVIQETSINNFNGSLWKGINASGIVLDFMRNTISNRLARNGSEWADVYSRHQSGTYNNQFMVVDYKRMGEGGKHLQDGFLTVLEQLPTLIVARDQTAVLRRQTYWSSYNVPFYGEIFSKAGYEAKVAKYGDYFSYNMTARARIFRREQSSVTDISSLFRLMRLNNFKTDPLSRCEQCSPVPNAYYAIASRGDLNDPNGKYPMRGLGEHLMGAIDAKITSSELSAHLEMVAVGGPTHLNEPPFDWRKVPVKQRNTVHQGQPSEWNFAPVHTQWSNISDAIGGFHHFAVTV